MSTHVPAWKRLGLKLKYAKDKPDSTAIITSTSIQGDDHDLDASERPVKRRRIIKNNSVASPGQNGTHSSADNPAEVRGSSQTSTPNRSAKQPETSAVSLNQTIQRKKSVTFSDETKQEDGDSRTTIDFPASSPGSTPKRSKKHPRDEESPTTNTTTTTTDNDTDPAASNHNITPTKKQSKPKTGKKSKTSTKDKSKSSSALDYLTQHRSARDSWKFNKILDVWILNHALDTQSIPSTHVPALAGYVKGLPAKAGSKDRLIKECKEALSASQLDGDTEEEDRNLFIRFIESQDGLLAAETRLDDFLQEHSRAAVLLWSVDETVSAKPSAQQGIVPVRTKKSRTSAPIDVSSSSESDSDSDSSDDSSDSEGETKVNGVGKPKVVVNGLVSNDDTSSSGTSSSEGEDSTSSSASSDSSSNEEDE